MAVAFALLAAGRARTPLVLPVRVEAKTLPAPLHTGSLTGYQSAIRSIATVMVAALGLPLSRRFTVFVYPKQGFGACLHS